MSELRMYSPTQTMNFDRCRLKWFYKVKGVQSSGLLGRKEIAGIAGQVLSSVLSAKERDGLEQGLAKKLVMDILKSRVAELESTGAYTVDPEVLDLVTFGLPAVIDQYYKTKPIPKSWKVLGIEEQLTDDHRSYVDIWGSYDRGYWLIDYKMKLKAYQSSIVHSATSFRYSWQLYHYAHLIRIKTNELPKEVGVIFLVLEPKPAVSKWMFEVDPDFYEVWTRNASRIWGEMTQEHKKWENLDVNEGIHFIPMSTTHEDGPFVCEYRSLCMELGGQILPPYFVEEGQ